MSRTVKVIKIVLISLFSLAALLFAGTYVILRYYEDDVVNYAIEASKDKFISRVEFGPADLAFWETFPNAAIRFTDVYIEETFSTKDTLIFAKEVYLEFNLMDLFRGEYVLEAVDLRSAQSHLKLDQKGKDNWHFWKSNPNDTSKFSLAMNEVSLENVAFKYEKMGQGFLLDIFAYDGKMDGDFESEQFELTAKMKALVHQWQSNGQIYAPDQEVKADVKLDANNKEHLFTFKDGEVTWGKMPLSIQGQVNTSEKSFVDLHFAGQGLDLSDIQAALPVAWRQDMANYSPDGKLNIAVVVKGETYGKKTPVIDMHAIVQNGSLEHKESGMSLDQIACELRYYRKDEADQLSIRSCNARLDDGQLQLTGTVKQLSQPEIDLTASLSARLEDIRDFFALDTLEVCQGNFSANAKLQGKLNAKGGDAELHWNQIQINGQAKVDDAMLQLRHSNRQFKDLASDISFNNKDASVNFIKGNVNGSDFHIHGKINNLLPFLTDEKERLQLQAELKSNQIDFTNLVETSASSSEHAAYTFVLPHRIDFKLNSAVGKFTFRKFEATQVKGVVELRGGRLVVDPVAFNTADGSFNAQLAFEDAGNNLYRMNCLANLHNINIQKLFTEFENFDQTFIQDKHISGTANATVQFRSMLTTSLDIMNDRIESLIDLSIDNGELNNLETLQDIAEYLRNNKWAAPFVDEDRFSERVRNIRFSKLENIIEIKDQRIIIPQMEIRSSAMDLSAEGEHGFDNTIRYTIGFSLRELLVKKERDWEEEDDGLGKRLFITMTGTADAPEFKIDREAARENRKEEIAQEKQNVKALLREELGLFKRDNSVGSYKESVSPSTSTTSLDWEGFDTKEDEKSPAPTPKDKKKPAPAPAPEPSKPQKKVPKWLEEKK